MIYRCCWIIALIIYVAICPQSPTSAGCGPTTCQRDVTRNSRSRPSKLQKLALPHSSRIITYDHDIAPLLRRHCVGCHAPERVGPFPLLTYRDARKRATLIARVVRQHFMPPWLPSGKSDPPFLAARGLTRQQIGLLREWALQGMPEGTPPHRPLSPPPLLHWRLGQPDLVLRTARPFHIAAEGTEVCPSFVLPLTADRWVRAVDIHPGNPGIVRAAALFVDDAGIARRLAADSGSSGYFAASAGLRSVTNRFSDWTPAAAPHVLPPDIALPLKRGTDLVLMLRCETTGQEEEEQTEVGLYFAPHPPRRTPMVVALGATEIFLTPKQTVTLTDTLILPAAVRALRIMPHAGLHCRTISVMATLPTGSVRSLLRIERWDPRWSEPYQWAVPVALPGGTRLTLTAYYDNTAANPVNRGQPLMGVGPGTEFMDASAGIQIEFVAERPEDEAALRQAAERTRDAIVIERQGGEGHG
jgi:hypothetical protein